MSVSLSKGGNVSLSKAAPSMKNVPVGLGWDARSTDGQDFDLMLQHSCWPQMAKCAAIQISSSITT